ncbi:MAG: hypothetical protein U0599_05980 [Vicinamibacteria bacterium]
MRKPAFVSVLGMAALLATACGEGGRPIDGPLPPVPAPTPTVDASVVVAGTHTGPTQISFVAAEPAPGATIAGCGPDATGCRGRVRMRFRLLSAAGGPVLDAIGFLHATNKIACYRGSTGAFELQAGVPAEVLIVFDEADPACGLPTSITNMKLVLSAPVQTDGLQEWAIRYELGR